VAVLAGLIAGWLWEYGLVGFMQGPLAKATNNTDLSWLTAMVVGGGLYYLLRPLLAKDVAVSPAAVD
jgi:nucleobase:cation symporter-1, NCS1 family